jgi:hypothetical protein
MIDYQYMINYLKLDAAVFIFSATGNNQQFNFRTSLLVKTTSDRVQTCHSGKDDLWASAEVHQMIQKPPWSKIKEISERTGQSHKTKISQQIHAFQNRNYKSRRKDHIFFLIKIRLTSKAISLKFKLHWHLKAYQSSAGHLKYHWYQLYNSIYYFPLKKIYNFHITELALRFLPATPRILWKSLYCVACNPITVTKVWFI